MNVAIITLSDKASRGERIDESGPYIRQKLQESGAQIVHEEILPDDLHQVTETLARLSDVDEVDIIFTTGGTGFGPRDVTPEATRAVVEREAPGIPEAMRRAGLETTATAMLSRAVAGIRAQTIIINLPGSLKAVEQSLVVIIPVLDHALEMLRGAEH